MITSIIIMSLFCNGWYLVTRQGMVLYYLNREFIHLCGGIDSTDGSGPIWIKYSKGYEILHWIYKPLFGCVTCMASIWGSIAYWTIYSFNSASIQLYPIAIIATAAMNLIINRIYDR